MSHLAVSPLGRAPATFDDDQVDACIAVYEPDYAPGELTREKATEIGDYQKKLGDMSKMLAAKTAEIKALEKDLDHERQIGAIGAKQAFFGGALAAKQNEQVSVQMQAVLPVVSTSQCLNTSSDSALSDITQL